MRAIGKAAAAPAVLLLLLLLTGVPALQNVKVSIPEAAAVGDTVTLYCNYDMETDLLYAIKWYKGKREFYRYIPKELPHVRVFPISGIEIDMSRSGPTSIVLRNVTPQISGRYYCEVSADAPSFHTVMSMGTLNVVGLPEEAPIIVSEKKRVAVGEILQTFCIGPPANTKINFTILINQKRVPEKEVSSDKVQELMAAIRESQQISNQDENSLEQMAPSSTKTIVTSWFSEGSLKPNEDVNRTASMAVIPVTLGLFHDNRLTIACRAEIFTLYSAQVHIDLEEDKPHLQPILGNQITSNGGDFSKCNQYIIFLILLTTFTIYKLNS